MSDFEPVTYSFCVIPKWLCPPKLFPGGEIPLGGVVDLNNFLS